MDSTDDDKDDDDDLALVVDLGFRMTLVMIVAPREDNFLVPNIIIHNPLLWMKASFLVYM